MKILGLETIAIAAIQPRDDNWRLHDEVQRGSLRAVLEEIGYAAPITVRKLATVEVRAHRRASAARGHGRDRTPRSPRSSSRRPTRKRSSCWRRWTRFTAPGQRTGTSSRRWSKAWPGRSIRSADLRHILATESATRLAKQAAALKDKAAVLPMPDGLDLRAHEHYDYVLVLSRSLTDWQNLLERFGLMDAASGQEQPQAPARTGAGGVGRQATDAPGSVRRPSGRNRPSWTRTSRSSRKARSVRSRSGRDVPGTPVLVRNTERLTSSGTSRICTWCAIVHSHRLCSSELFRNRAAPAHP